MNMKEDPNNAVSVYNEQDAMDNFPVLKAFQQYIDAEQTKARKRLIFLCVFFGLLMAGVISVFVSLLMAAGEKNQQLNDKLFEYVMQDRGRPVVQQPQSDAALKVITDTLGNLQKQLADQQAKNAELSEKMTKKPEGPTPDQVALQRRMDAESDKLKKATALLLSERNKLSEQKEELRRLEVELQRRRLYPEYYSQFYHWLTVNEYNAPMIMTSLATMAVYKDGNEWRKQVISYIEGNIIFMEEFFKKHFP